MNHSERNILIDQLLEYIHNPYINQAVLLHGAWGSGKTHFIKNEFGALEEVKIIYTSANGIASEQKIILQIYSTTILGKYKDSKTARTISSLAMGAVRLGLGKLGSEVSEINFQDFISFKENAVLVIDDIERLDESYSLISFLGFVNSLTEHEKVKVILIGEEDKLMEKLNKANNVEKESYNYKEVKEKYIYRTFYYDPELKRSIPSIIDSYKGNVKYHKFLEANQGLIIDIWQKLNVVNLRTIKFYFDSLSTIYKIALDNIEKIKRHFFVGGAVFSKYYKENNIDIKSKEVPTVLDREFPKVYTTIDRKALEIHKNHVNEDDALFPVDFRLDYSGDYLFIKSFYDSIILGNTNKEQIKIDIENVLIPKDETKPWQQSLEIVRSFRNYDHEVVEAAFTKTIDYIKQNKYDLNELVVFVNISVELIQQELTSCFPDVESLCEFINPALIASLPNTQFNFNDYRRLSFQHNEKIVCITTLEKELIECKEFLIKQFSRGKIDELLAKASENLEFLVPENIVYILGEGNTDDLEKITDFMTSSIQNINTAYQVLINPNFHILGSEPQVPKALDRVLSLLQEKSKKDKVMEYIANEIITKFPDYK